VGGGGTKEVWRQLAARKGAKAVTRARLLWAALAAAAGTATLVAAPTLATIAGITYNFLD
jgi:hypothetical protein